MILNLGSLAFNTFLAEGGGTPAWGTEMGQGDGYKFSFDEMGELFTAMVYNSVSDIDQVFCPLGKGGNQQRDYEFVIASLFKKIFVNGVYVPGAQFLLLVVKKLTGDFHVGRRTIKYNPRMSYKGDLVNDNCYKLMEEALGISSGAAWFIHEMNCMSQDELHFKAYVLDDKNPITFGSNTDRRKAFLDAVSLDSGMLSHDEEAENLSTTIVNQVIVNDLSSRSYSKEELVALLKNMKKSEISFAPHIFGFKYGQVCKDNGISLEEVVEEAGFAHPTAAAEPHKGAGIARAIADGLFGMSFFHPTAEYKYINNGTKFIPPFPKNTPLQKIIYGAPGTGKSHQVKNFTKGRKEFRTTFHPDSDYSTFVGAYKPTMETVPAMYQDKLCKEKEIIYTFVPQAFTKAYVEAWLEMATN